ncbi:hypothetical protein J2Z35_002069 [Acetoanaerobium pronyense]|uniref:Copper amine oxidase-like N-terminal domain-containing protein n=1 Tax=Acetoanaerobium pronyense TaxID=1482736 RepID=A0ABS4KKH1_9FIRM|nr:copper amine oxidase N-terminal domain-containing protein [Acetoanaerobium pronyense]MBP2028268.1 hypothetical protein [Acetoanaerobium pronyense]
MNKTMRRLAAVTLVGSLAAYPVMGFANQETLPLNIEDEVVPIRLENKEVKKSLYGKLEGEVFKVENLEHFDRIFLNTKDGSEIHLNVDKTPIYSLESMSKVEKSSIEVGDTLQAFYDVTMPMILIYPPQYSPKVIVVMDSDSRSLKVSKFDEDFLSTEKDMINNLKLNIGENTIIEDLEGNTDFSAEDVKNNELMVFYTATTRSIPPQTSPQKIIVLPEIKDEGHVIVEEPVETEIPQAVKEIIESQSYYSNNSRMVPVASIGNALGYNVVWNAQERKVSLTKYENTIEVLVDTNQYIVNGRWIKMPVNTEIRDSRTYSEENFIEFLLGN